MFLNTIFEYFAHPCLLLYIYIFFCLSQLNSFIETVDFLREQQHKDNENDKNKDKKSSKEYHYMPETYNECKDRFGIVFHDNLMVSC